MSGSVAGGQRALSRRHALAGGAGAVAGAGLGAVALLAGREEWVFFYVLGAPWYVADIMHDAAHSPRWLYQPVVCAYFAAFGATAALLVTSRLPRALVAVVLAVVLVIHIGVALTGARRVFAELSKSIRESGLPAAEIWPKPSPRARPSPGP
jgi:hypothetical protein